MTFRELVLGTLGKTESTRSIMKDVPVHQSGQHTVVLIDAVPLAAQFEPSHRTTTSTLLGAASTGSQARPTV